MKDFHHVEKKKGQLRSERERREGSPYAKVGCKYGACERAASARLRDYRCNFSSSAKCRYSKDYTVDGAERVGRQTRHHGTGLSRRCVAQVSFVRQRWRKPSTNPMANA